MGVCSHAEIDKACQDLMRHSDINLTMGLYTHTMLDDRSKAVNALPDFSKTDREIKTGTADMPENGAYLQGDLQGQNLPKLSKNGKICRAEVGAKSGQEKRQKPLFLKASGASDKWWAMRDLT